MLMMVMVMTISMVVEMAMMMVVMVVIMVPVVIMTRPLLNDKDDGCNAENNDADDDMADES